MTVENKVVAAPEVEEKPVAKRKGGIRLSLLVTVLLLVIVLAFTYQRLFPSSAAVEKELLTFMGDVNQGEGVETIDKVMATNGYALISMLKVEYAEGSKDDGRMIVGTSAPWWIGKSSEDFPRTQITFIDNKIDAITMTY